MLNILMYQMNPRVGDLSYNLQKITDFYLQHNNCDLILTPELSLCGYSVFDDLFSKDFQVAIQNSIQKIVDLTAKYSAHILVGALIYEDDKIFNVLLLIGRGKILEIIYKSKLPNYGVFNEVRYFAVKSGTANIITINDVKIGIFLCEDMWHKDKVLEVLKHQPQICISINASVFESDKHNIRLGVAKQVYDLATHKFSLIYLNNVGAIDDVVFDGNSFVMDEHQNVLSVLSHTREDSFALVYDPLNNGKIICEVNKTYNNDENYLNYSAIALALKNFMNINGFEGVILGLSGGIDSVISATMCADILGSDRVIAVSMPTQYTSQLSKDIIAEVAENLAIKLIELPIDNIVKSYEEQTQNVLDFNNNGVAENLQARIRGNLLMALSNQYPKFMVLTTGNKSEIATGYSTLYGDSCGAFNLLKDLYKTQVFSLAKYLNKNIASFSKLNKLNLIPNKAIDRKPTAELKDNQFDEDNLMEYSILDKIIYDIVEKNLALSVLYQSYGIEKVDKVIRLLKNSQHKRVQSATGVKLSSRSFSAKEYQYPIATAYKINNKIN